RVGAARQPHGLRRGVLRSGRGARCPARDARPPAHIGSGTPRDGGSAVNLGPLRPGVLIALLAVGACSGGGGRSSTPPSGGATASTASTTAAVSTSTTAPAPAGDLNAARVKLTTVDRL